jgi:hypothetical protein
MVRNRSAFLDGLKARLHEDRAEREKPVVGGEPRRPGADREAWVPASSTDAENGAGAPGGGRDAATTPRSAPDLEPRPPFIAQANAAPTLPDHRKAPKSWSESGMPERVRQAIASVRRISLEGAQLGDQELEPPGLREAPRPFAPVDAPEQSAPPDPPQPSAPPDPPQWSAPPDPPQRPAPPEPPQLPALPDPPQPSAPPDPPWPSLLEIGEPSAPRATPPFAAFDRFEPLPPFLDRREPQPPDIPEPPPSLESPEPPPFLELPEPLPGLNGPARRPHWRHGEEEPRPGRGIRIAALAMASAVVLLVGSGLGALLAGWRLELPSLPFGTAAAPEPVAESQAPPPVANTSQAPPPIAEVLRVEPAPVPPAPAIEPSPPAGTAGLPLPPPPKPAPWSKIAAEGAATTNDAIDALLRETPGSGGPLQPLGEEEAALAAIRVFVHYTASAAGEEATAMHLARLLEAKGFAVEARAVDFPIDVDSIRYFFPADRDDAEALSASLKGQIPGGAAPPVLDFTAYEPKPSPGSLEIWIGT